MPVEEKVFAIISFGARSKSYRPSGAVKRAGQSGQSTNVKKARSESFPDIHTM